MTNRTELFTHDMANMITALTYGCLVISRSLDKALAVEDVPVAVATFLEDSKLMAQAMCAQSDQIIDVFHEHRIQALRKASGLE